MDHYGYSTTQYPRTTYQAGHGVFGRTYSSNETASYYGTNASLLGSGDDWGLHGLMAGMNQSGNGPVEPQEVSSPDFKSAEPISGNAAIVICIVSVSLSLITGGGNLLVIAAFRANKKLQTITNYFILSLACADIVVGLISMNLFTSYVVQGQWTLGAVMCDFWLTVDYVACNASVMNLVIICVDRYLAITKPLTYRVKRTKTRVRKMIAGAWVLSFFLWAPVIILWPFIEGRRVPENECQIQFIYTNPMVTFCTALAAFYIPTVVMIILYWKIYKANVKHQKYQKAFRAVNHWKAVGDDGNLRRILRKNIRNGKPRAEHKDEEKSNGCNGNVEHGKTNGTTSKSIIKITAASPAKYLENRSEEIVESVEMEKVANNGVCNGNGVAPNTPLLKLSDPYELLSDAVKRVIASESKSAEEDQVFSDDHLLKPPDPYALLSDAMKRVMDNQPDTTEDDVTNSETGKTPVHEPRTPLSREHSEKGERVNRNFLSVPAPKYDDESESDSISTTSMEQDVTKPFLAYALSNGHGCNGAKISMQISPKTAKPAQNGKHNFTGRPIRRSASTPFSPSRRSRLGSGEGFKRPQLSDRRSNRSPRRSRCESADDAVAPSSSRSSARLGDVANVLMTTSKNVRDRLSAVSKKDNKAARMLAAILFAFVATWLPYNILVLISTLCDDCVNDFVWKVSYWLCYLNSTINPVCYALCSKEFRRTFRKILCCRKKEESTGSI